MDGINVNYFGTNTPLNQCASISVSDARTILVQPWDKTILSEIEKAIGQSGIGINPQNDGELIRLPIPPLTEERRKSLAKQAKAKGEDAKIGIRNARKAANDVLKKAQKDKEISEDDLKRSLENVQKETDAVSKKVDELLIAKEKEILEI